MEEEIKLGFSFLIETPPNGKHLCIIIANISENYLLVNTTTSNTQVDPDRDCIITPGDGVPDYIELQSTIAYKHARTIRKNHLNSLIKTGEAIFQGFFLEEYVYVICCKGAKSKQIKKKYQNILKECVKTYETENFKFRKFG